MGSVWDGALCTFGERMPERVKPLRWAVEAVAEAAGTFLLTAVGASARNPALTNGLALTALVYGLAPISGAKLNPAASFGAALADIGASRKKSSAISVALCRLALEWASQFGGACAGVKLARKMASATGNISGCFTPPAGTPMTVVLANESVGTLLVVFIMLRTAAADEAGGSPRFGSHAPLAIGFAAYAAADSAGRFSGACFNPARYLASVALGSCPYGSSYARAFLGGHALGAACAALAHFAFSLCIRKLQGDECRKRDDEERVPLLSEVGSVGRRARLGAVRRVGL